MFWKLFGSSQKVEEALAQSVGYDISPAYIQPPANEDVKPVAVDKPVSKDELYFIAPWEDQA